MPGDLTREGLLLAFLVMDLPKGDWGYTYKINAGILSVQLHIKKPKDSVCAYWYPSGLLGDTGGYISIHTWGAVLTFVKEELAHENL